ncbi:N-acetylmuramoyl-L-alanine amidase [Amaricoccus solimangrovi]|uniref:N-acetylmuramoyl-L-alanine amidase n=1 Tax=Amaricoccus solimangrovi TaxID=2589815 RepID=A0A501WQF3_9RHOB|nr:N-acetylmuramoyl-L-alanine amidase [Amaricoccus solimangrovi]TPE49221.1 N-acetylmuramoyl-L-alanine amidase [Amaricoccus solimangrovi]
MLESGFIFRMAAALLAALALAPVTAPPRAPGWPAAVAAAETGPSAAPSAMAPAPRPARLDPARIALRRWFFGRGLSVTVGFEAPRPFRVFTLTDPPRLVVDLEGLDAAGFDPAAVARSRAVARVSAAPARPGWARLVLDLARPFALETAEMGEGGLALTLRRVGAEDFAARSGAPPGVVLGGDGEGGHALVVLDPGHGGIDPGATRDGVAEKDVVLAFSEALGAALEATGRFRVATTRDTDVFLPLAARADLARRLGARAFVSIHANAVADEAARGGIVFTLSEAGSSTAARERAAAENRADAAAGPAAPGPGDSVAEVLGGLLRAEGQARSIDLARALGRALGPVTGAGPAPLQSADFQVLRVPDVPAALLELGFLSNAADRRALTSPEWRARAAAAIAAGMVGWLDAGGPLTRK